jgi:hypothetical protein
MFAVVVTAGSVEVERKDVITLSDAPLVARRTVPALFIRIVESKH